jgi:hypothetical protein
VVLNNHAGPAVLYKNRVAANRNWVILKLVGTKSNRDAIGARVTVAAGDLTQMREVTAGSGYASQSMLPVHFGLDRATKIGSIDVRWPSGTVDRITDVPPNKVYSLVEGDGILRPGLGRVEVK